MSQDAHTADLMLAITEVDVAQFLAHSDHRHIGSFFLGWVFVAALYHVARSPLVQSLYTRIGAAIYHPTSDPEAYTSEKDSFPSGASFASRRLSSAENATLIFTLSLCFLLSSIASVASLSNFDARTGGAVCAFVVAWSGVATQCTRLVGLIIAILELRQLGRMRWETIAFAASLGAAIILIFAGNAISVGTILPVPQLNTALCFRQHFLPTSIAASLIFLLLELYSVARLISFIAPSFLSSRHKVSSVLDIRVLRALSLVMLELLTIVPGAIRTNPLGDSIPFSIGAIIVLAAFNHRSPETVHVRMDSIPPSVYTIPSLPPSRAGSAAASTRTANPAIYPAARVPQPRIAHPFSANLEGYKIDLPGHEWLGPSNQGPDTARSSASIDSIMAKSIAAARVQTASRTRRPDLVPSEPAARKSHFAEASGDEWRVSQHETPNVPAPPPHTSRKILPSQTQFALQFERETPAGLGVRRPTVVIPQAQQASLSPGSSEGGKTIQALNSAVYGSDILRTNERDVTKTAVVTRNNSRVSFANSLAQDSFMNSPDGSYYAYGNNTGMARDQRQSWFSMSEELGTVQEVDSEVSSGGASVKTYRTFGAFEAPAQPVLMSLPSGPRLAPGQRLGGVGLRGPRPPPIAFASPVSRTPSQTLPSLPPMSRRQEKKRRISNGSSLRSEVIPSGGRY